MKSPITGNLRPHYLGLLGFRRFGRRGAEQPLDLRDRDVICLAGIVLAPKGGIRREELALKCWPRSERKRAAQSLSQALGVIRRRFQQLDQNALVEQDRLLALDQALEVDVLNALNLARDAHPAQLRAAAEELLKGFLHGIDPEPSEEFDWLTIAKENIRLTAVDYLERSTLKYLEIASYGGTVDTAHRLAEIAPENESHQVRICSALMSARRTDEAIAVAKAAISAQKSQLEMDPGDTLTALLAEAEASSRRANSARSVAYHPRLAVLPFKASSKAPSEQALAYGLMTEVIYDLSSHSDLEVLSRALTDNLDTMNDPGGYLSRAHSVDLTVEGTILPSPNGRHFFLSATDVSTGNIIWNARVEIQEHALEQLSAVAQRLAAAVCTHLPKVGGSQRASAKRFRTLSVHAKARMHYDAFALDQHEDSYLELREALRQDSNHAPSWLLLAYLCEGLEVRGIQPPGTNPTADRRHAIERAFALDPYDGRIQIEVGDMHFSEGNFAKADVHYRKGIAMTRGSSELFSIKAKYMIGAFGDQVAARSTLRKAQTVFPKDDPWLLSNATRTLTLLGDYEEALAVARYSPPSVLHLACHAVAALKTGHLREALDVRADLLQSSGGRGAEQIFQSKHFRPYARAPVVSDRLLADAVALDQQSPAE